MPSRYTGCETPPGWTARCGASLGILEWYASGHDLKCACATIILIKSRRCGDVSQHSQRSIGHCSTRHQTTLDLDLDVTSFLFSRSLIRQNLALVLMTYVQLASLASTKCRPSSLNVACCSLTRCRHRRCLPWSLEIPLYQCHSQ